MAQPISVSSANSAYLEALFEQYQADPASVDAQWRSYFESLDRAGPGPGGDGVDMSARGQSEFAAMQSKVFELISALRYSGHRGADLDPLKLEGDRVFPDLDPALDPAAPDAARFPPDGRPGSPEWDP